MSLVPVSICLLLLATSVLGDGHSSPCFADQQQCLQEFRSLLNNRNYFWFGTDFYRRCPTRLEPSTGVTDTWCINPSDNTTIMSRLLPSYSENLLQTIASTTKLAEVTFSGESRAHFSCGHQYPANPRTESGLKVDPTQTTTWGLARSQSMPSISWPTVATTRPGDMKYTVLVLDLGYLYLHGFYINSNLNMRNSQVVYPYTGPVNPSPIPNPYLWIVLPQLNGDLDLPSVNQWLSRMMKANRDVFQFTEFVNTFSGYNELTQAAMTVMNIQGDPYGAQFLKDMDLGDTCPYFVSQNKYFQRAVEWARLPASWTQGNAYTNVPMDATALPYLSSLNASLEVTYSTGDIEFESCCTKHTYIRSETRADPFKPYFMEPERPVQLREAPRVKLNSMTNNMYQLAKKNFTLVMVDFGSELRDMSAPAPTSPAFIIHWIVTDISQADLNTGNHVLPYFGPNPFQRDDPRMYAFLLLEQTRSIQADTLRNYVLDQCDTFPHRCFYRLNQLLQDWGLYNICGLTWYYAQQDAFARQRMYRQWGVKDKYFVCDGIKGYEYMCPLTCTDFVTDQGSMTLPHLTFVMTSALTLAVSLFRL